MECLGSVTPFLHHEVINAEVGGAVGAVGIAPSPTSHETRLFRP